MLLTGLKSWKKMVERSVKRSLSSQKELHRRRRNSSRIASSAAVELLEDRTLLSAGSLAGNTEELIENGDFETGNFTGWAIDNSGSGGWQINSGTFDPPGPGTSLPPVSGNFDAVSYQGGPGLHLLSENIIVPEDVTSATLSWSDRIRNHSSTFSDPNQEWRVLVQNTSGGLIQEVFSTNPGDPLQQVGPNHRSFDLTSLFQSLAGQTVQISFQQQDNQGYFNISLDDVSLLVSTGDELSIDLNGEDDPGIDFAADFVEDGGPTLIVDTDLTVSVGSTPAAPIRVAVVGGGPSSDNSGFQAIVNQLNDDTFHDFSATLVQPTEIDTLSELSAYDTVVIGGSGQTGFGIGQFDLFQAPLRAWAEAGGGVVMTGWGIRRSGISTGSIHPDINAIIPVDTDAYFGAFSQTTVHLDYYEEFGGTTVTSHPVIEGVNDFNLSPGDYSEFSQGGVDPGAAVLGTTNGRATVVIGVPGDGRSVYLGPIYSGSSYYNNSELRTGDADHLLENAVAWAGGNFTSTVTTLPEEIFTTHYNGQRIGTIDTVTGNGADIGATGTSQTFAAAFDTDGSGTLYTLVYGQSGNARLATVNTTTGVATPVAGPGTGTNMISLEVAEDGTMYGIGYSNGLLYQIDKTTGVATAIGNTGIAGNMDLAFDAAGTLWATVGNQLWTVDTTTGASTYQTAISGILSGSVMGIMFDSSDSLLATAYTTNSPLYRIDTATGAATVIAAHTTFNAPHGGDILLDADDATIDSATVRITNPLDLTAESLSVNTAGTGITAIYNNSTGTLTLTGTESREIYEQVLRTTRYNNVSQDPNTTDRIIEFSVTSGTQSSAIATSVVSVAAVNDPPVINAGDLSLNTDTINEGGSVVLTGSFTDPESGDTHTLEVNWGDGSQNTIVNLIAGASSFTLGHIYSDDNPTGTPVDLNQISVTVSDASGASDTASTSLTVKNVAPLLSDLTVNSIIYENNIATLSGIINDPGVADTFTVIIDWNALGNAGGPGEGTTTLTQADLNYLGGGQWSFSTTHQYLDDNPTASSQDTYTIGITVIDDDGGTSSTSNGAGSAMTTFLSPIHANDLTSPTFAPVLDADRITFSGPGVAHSHYSDTVELELQVHNSSSGLWETIWTTTLLPGRQINFNGMEIHFSPRDIDALRFNSDPNQNNTFHSWGNYTSVTIDRDVVLSPTVTVRNIPPYAIVNGLSTVEEGTPVTLNGRFLDLGTLDTHTQSWTVTADNGQVITPGSGSSFTFTPDDNGLYTVAYTVTDDDGGSYTREFELTVENVSPTLSDVTVTDIISENGIATLSGVINDPGTADTFTVVIDWNALGNVGGSGEGTTTLTQSDLTDLGNGQWGFSTTHQYLDDNPTASLQDTYEIGITVTDDDGGVGTLANSVLPSVTTYLSPANAEDLNSTSFTPLSNAGRISFAGSGIAHSHGITAVDLELQVHNTSTGAWETIWTDTIPPGGQIYFGGMEILFSPRNIDAVRFNSNPDQFNTFHNWGTATAITIESVSVPPPTVIVKNVDPVATLSGLTTVDEGTLVTFNGSFTDQGTLDTHLENWSVTSDNGQVVAPGSGSSFSFTPVDDGIYTISYTVTDDDGGSDTQELVLTVENVDPTLSDVSVTEQIDENGLATLSGIINDPGILDTFTVVIDWNTSGNLGGTGEGTTTLTQSDLTDLGNGQWSFSAVHQYLDDNPTASSQDAYTIGITVTDDDGGVAEDLAAATVIVNNVDPQLTELFSDSADCGQTAEGEAVSLWGSFTDVGTLDLHSATIDWGDGTSSAAAIDETNGSGTFSGSHAYATGGIYTVTVSLSDDDGGSDTLTTTVIVTGVGVQEIDGQTVLQIIGTHQDDHVTVNQQGNGLIKVHADFLPEQNGFRTFNAADIDLLWMALCDGDDTATIAGNIDLPAIIYGGGGNDHLNGGAGSNVILGGAGDDTILGGSGRDILIGGTGSDRIVGGPGEDILAGGSSVYESDSAAELLAHTAALLAIQQEWNADTTQAERKANLSDDGASSTRLNDDFFIRLGQEILDDVAEDQLTGSSDEDWFLLSTGDTPQQSSLASSSSTTGNAKGKAKK